MNRRHLKTIRPGFGSVPGIKMADDFDAPLEDFAHYLPIKLSWMLMRCVVSQPRENVSKAPFLFIAMRGE